MVTITVTNQAGTNRIDLPQLAGRSIVVFRRGVGFLKSSEITTLPTGGFQLTNSADLLQAGEVFFVWVDDGGELISFGRPKGKIVQYPHTINIITASDTTQDSQGDWNVTDTATRTLACRAESSSGNAWLSTADGNRIDFSWIVYLPKIDGVIGIGSKVTVFNDTEFICSDTVKRFSKGQLNCRIWL